MFDLVRQTTVRALDELVEKIGFKEFVYGNVENLYCSRAFLNVIYGICSSEVLNIENSVAESI